jgi:hypothetical protein
MTAQSVAETISSHHPNLKILLTAMNGRESCEYVKELPVSIDAMKFHIDNKMVSAEDFLKTCTHKGNFYMMAGISNETEIRYYHPGMAVYLLEEIAPEFDLVIADAGNELDNGLAVGALSLSEEVFLVVTQQESVLRRYEKKAKLLDDLGVGIAASIINKYYEQDPYGLPYLSERLETGRESIFKVDSAGWSRQAEIDNRTLLEYKNETYTLDIIALANHILSKAGLAEIKRQRKSRWKSFI